MTTARIGLRSPILPLPREHGAYVQLGLALTCGLALGHGAPRAWGQTLLTALVFLASESLLLLSGHRGPDARFALQARVKAILATLSLLTLLLASAIWWTAPVEQWKSLAFPLLLALILLALVLAKREHTTLGELIAAWALSATAYPVAILGGAGPREAGLLTLALGCIQSVGTTTVRAFLESLKRSGQPLPRAIPLCLGCSLAGLGFTFYPPFAWIFALALVPNMGIAAWLLLAPPPPRQMRRLGWLLTLAAMTGALPVVFALR